MTDTLKPCPFECGENQATVYRDNLWQVVCGCGVDGPVSYHEDEAVKFWNTRAEDPLITLLREDVAAGVKRIGELEAQNDEFFPMLDGPPITWKVARLVYKMYNSSQSLENIAKRGGFGWDEVAYMFREYEKFEGDQAAILLRKGPLPTPPEAQP